MILQFYKYQACGNDFVIIDESENDTLVNEVRSAISQQLCDRHFAIGCDSVLFLSADKNNFRMRIFERDGSESDMCGNGIRCAAHHLMQKINRNQVDINTERSTIRVRARNGLYEVDMGLPGLINNYISEFLDPSYILPVEKIFINNDIKKLLNIHGIDINNGYMVNTGEPHIVFILEDITPLNLNIIGFSISKEFPKGVNINLMTINDNASILIRTYERGVANETLSCGTGSTACALVARRIRGMDDTITVNSVGGTQEIRFVNESMKMVGPATKIFKGTIELEIPNHSTEKILEAKSLSAR